jgi:hypothetical protein
MIFLHLSAPDYLAGFSLVVFNDALAYQWFYNPTSLFMVMAGSSFAVETIGRLCHSRGRLGKLVPKDWQDVSESD